MYKATFNEDKTLDRDTEQFTWLRPDEATKYFSVGRSALDRLAIQCDAKKKVGTRIVLYDIEKLDKYIKSL